MVLEISDYIYSKFDVTSSGTGIAINKKVYRSTVQKFLNQLKAKKLIQGTPVADFYLNLDAIEQKETARDIFEDLKSKCAKANEEHKQALIASGHSVDINNFSLVVDMCSNDKYLIEKGIISWRSPQFYLEKFNRFERDTLIAEAENVIVEYNPKTLLPKYTTTIERETIPVYNSCVLPNWRHELPAVATQLPTEPPPILHDLFNSMFLKKEALHYFYCWVKTAIFDRNQTYLCLIGAKGIGKSLFLTLLKNAVGARNYAAAPRSFVSKEFNSVLINKVVVSLEEMTANKTDHIEKLKTYVEDETTLEIKGVRADTLYKLHASFVITNNSKLRLKIEQDDRRFSVLPLTTKTLREVWPESKIMELVKAVSDETIIEQFGRFLYGYNTTGFSNGVPYKDDFFNEIVVLNLNMWQRDIYEKLITRKKDCYSYSSLLPSKEMRSFRPRSRAFVEEWLGQFLYNGVPIGRMELISGKWYIIPNKYLMPVS